MNEISIDKQIACKIQWESMDIGSHILLLEIDVNKVRSEQSFKQFSERLLFELEWTYGLGHGE
jgi:hypothetical protein